LRWLSALRSWRSSRSGSFALAVAAANRFSNSGNRRVLAIGLALLATTIAAPVQPVAANQTPLPVVPLIAPAPVVPVGPLSTSLTGAYQAIVQAGSIDPRAAQRASFLYAQARERAARGDYSGALAAAASARALAGSRERAPFAPSVVPWPVPSPPAR
jgi:hypothetical protein